MSSARIGGRASAEGTGRYRRRMVAAGRALEAHFRGAADQLQLSSLGLGTYLGAPDQLGDRQYREAIRAAVELGINVLDSAINYRFQRSERVIGALLKEGVSAGLKRDELLIATKGGFVPFDGAPPSSAEAFVAHLNRSFFETGLASPEEMAAGGQHCIAPRYLEHQLRSSLNNLGLETIDLYLIHNPEAQLHEIGRAVFDKRLLSAFVALERQVAAGRIGSYGVATWDGFRVEPEQAAHLSLARILELAREAGGPGHHFSTIELPYNRGMMEAAQRLNQRLGDRAVSTLEAASKHGLSVLASATLEQGRFAEGQALQAIQRVRSTPGVRTALVGMSQRIHVEENLEVARLPPLSDAELRAAGP